MTNFAVEYERNFQAFYKYDLAASMADRKAAGLRVRLIVDDLESSIIPVQTLLSAGVNVEHHDYNPILHHKYAILDEGADHPRVITGSHNWTTSATVRNDENSLIVHDRDIANIYRQEFEARWAELSPASGIYDIYQILMQHFINASAQNTNAIQV